MEYNIKKSKNTEKNLKEGLIPHINKKEDYINPVSLGALGGGFIVTRNQDNLEGEQQYFNAGNTIDKIFD